MAPRRSSPGSHRAPACTLGAVGIDAIDQATNDNYRGNPLADESAQELMGTGRAIRQFDEYLQDDGVFKSYDKAVATTSYAYEGKTAEISDVSSALTAMAAPTRFGNRSSTVVEGANGKPAMQFYDPGMIDDLEVPYAAAQRPPVKPTVTARSTVNGHIFEDTNQNARVAPNMDRPTLISGRVALKEAKSGDTLPNGTMRTAHAEMGNIQQASEAGVTRGADMTMEVSGRRICGHCEGDIPAMAAAAELNSLTVIEIESGKTFVWSQGIRSIRKGEQ